VVEVTPNQLKFLAFGLFVPGGILLCAFQFFFLSFIQRRYIIKRYEEETNLAETEKFLEVYRPFIIMFPSLKPGCYSTHLLLVMLWSDETLKKNIHFKDSPSRKELLSHFSKKERVLTAVTAGCALLAVALLGSFGFLYWLWTH
jgi:nitrate reductase NapE component